MRRSIQIELPLLLGPLLCTACLLTPPGAPKLDFSSLDGEVLAVAIEDFAASGDACAPVADHPIRVDAMTLIAGGMTSDAQVRADIETQDWRSVAALLRHLRERNVVSQPLTWQPPSSLGVVVQDLSGLRSEYDFLEWFPDTRCHLRLWLPGYSLDGQFALVRFAWGPTSHGATATYLLEKEDRNWRVRWKHIAVYAELLPNKRMQLTSHRVLRRAW